MEMAETILSLHRALAPWRQSGARIALVPTMGNLHAGHLRLVEKAECLAECVVVSIFVNPLQFGAGEDYRSYPRTLDQDSEKLSALGVNLLFAPSVHEIYSTGEQPMIRVEMPGLFNILCGAFRPGHFAGVATVVIKLFNLIQPHLAVFGTKDYQQLVVIKRLVADLSIPVEIVAVETVREPDGLAMSSRNSYLTLDERRRAPVLQQALRSAANRLRKGR
jgi:pantoate--beta-alanine ligase